MTGTYPTIPLATLYERESAKGTRYFTGRLGLAKIVMFKSDPAEDGTPTWSLLIQQPPSKTDISERPRQAAPAARRSPAGYQAAPLRSVRQRPRARPIAANGNADAAPFFSDPVDDLYREAGR